MSKSKKRFETSQSINRKIREEQERIVALRKEGHANAESARVLQPHAETSKEAYDAFWWHCKERDRCFKSAERIENSVIPKLSEKLAEFNTVLLPGISDDRSVTAR